MTNDDIRIACAEIVGWDVEKKQLGGVFIYRDKNGQMAGALPNYPNSLDACKELIEFAEKEDIGHFALTHPYQDKWCAEWHWQGSSVAKSWMDTPELAICKAFILCFAPEKWKEETK